MIRRQRPPKSCPPSLDPLDKKGAGYKELGSVTNWYASLSGNSPQKRPEFRAYKGKDVVEALGELFHHKCAYCESRYAVTQPVDVEHWRPKARVDDAAGHTGYGWLAMNWENLLPSCIDCNRARIQTVPDSTATSQWTQHKVGKADQFPIANPKQRWTFGNSSHPEISLLLDPCTDDPNEFFDFDDKGGLVLPKRGLSKPQMEKALKSIQVYALNRKALVDERIRHLLRLEPIFKVIVFLYEASGNMKLPKKFQIAAGNLVSDTLNRLHESCADNMPYSQFIKRRLERFLRDELGAS